MSVLTVSNLSKSYDPVDIFAGVTFSLPQQGRYAIVGPNGVGKTTLLRVISGEEAPSSGAVQIARGTSMGFLRQESVINPHSGKGSKVTLWEACLVTMKDVRLLEKEIHALGEQMGAPDLPADQVAELMENYGKLQMRFEMMGGYDYETRIRQVLTGLGFEEKDYDYPLEHLSGGQRTRSLLARLLLAGHDMLLLDEPTNHLDIHAVEWLEGFLRDWPGTALIVSHDRYFIDRVATHILEMDRGVMEMYRGNYTTYLEQRDVRWDDRMKHYLAEKARLENELDYIKRNMAGQNVAQAKGKLRRLSRYLLAVEQLGLTGVKGKKWSEIASQTLIGNTMSPAEAHDRIKAIPAPTNRHQKLNLQLTPKRRSGRIILRTKSLTVGFPGNELFSSDDLELERLSCVAIVGPNGSGKTTFLRTILKQQPPLKGEVTLGASLDLAYFSQAHESLHPNLSVMEEIAQDAPHMLPGEIRGYLARFLFSGEDVFKPVSVLSGGERGRLSLAKLALTDANLLLLDEPTNHLDIPAQEILQEVVTNFQGTTILVTHDRYLIDALASQVWVIDTEDKHLHVYDMSWQDYRDGVKIAQEAEERVSVTGRDKHAASKREANRKQAEERRTQERLAEIETFIHIQEEQLAALARKLENPPSDSGQVQKLGAEYVKIENSLNEMMAEWEKLLQKNE